MAVVYLLAIVRRQISLQANCTGKKHSPAKGNKNFSAGNSKVGGAQQVAHNRSAISVAEKHIIVALARNQAAAVLSKC
jgi:hypothetical protein